MLVTEFGIITDVKPVHPEKAALPILVTEFGIVTDVKPVISQHRLSGMILTLFPKVKLIILGHP